MVLLPCALYWPPASHAWLYRGLRGNFGSKCRAAVREPFVISVWSSYCAVLEQLAFPVCKVFALLCQVRLPAAAHCPVDLLAGGRAAVQGRPLLPVP